MQAPDSELPEPIEQTNATLSTDAIEPIESPDQSQGTEPVKATEQHHVTGMVLPTQPSSPSVGKMVLSILLALLVVITLLGGVLFFQMRHEKKVASLGQVREKPEVVTTAIVKKTDWQPFLEAVASLSAGDSVTISTDNPGIVTKTPLVSGSQVKEGDLLVQLDSELEEAQLRSAEAELALAKSRLERTVSLASKSVIVARAELDQAKAEYDQALAGIDEIRAKIRKKSIYAPFDGMLGISQVSQGQYLKSGDEIISLDNFEKINVDFSLPQQDLSELHQGQEIIVTADGALHQEFQGQITAINSQLDQTTRNIAVQGEINNDQGVLRGGMFAKVRVILPQQRKVITLPITAINYAPYGDSVFVVETITPKKGDSYQGLRQQVVTLGATRGDQVEIVHGLKVGEEVVTSGIFKLHPREPVIINNEVGPSDNPAPEPEDS